MIGRETCARCGHQTPTCPNCDDEWPFLGASIDDRYYCHTFVEGDVETCYEVTSRGDVVPRLFHEWVIDRG